MNFTLTQEQQIIQETAAKRAKQELEPVASTLDTTKDREILKSNLKKLAVLGFNGSAIDPRYGGTGAGSFGLTETDAGSDAAAMKTTATDRGSYWLLSGKKVFITSAEYAGVFVVWAVTDKHAPKSKGISAFLVEPHYEGFVVGRDEHKMGQVGSCTNEIILDNCRVPKENLLGTINDGFRIAVRELGGGRIGIGSMALGIGLAAMDYATSYAKERIQFDKPIIYNQAIQWMIADNYTRLEAARLLLLQAAYKKENGMSFIKEASMAKLFATEVANKACYDAMQILGGYGYTKDYPIERLYRDVRVTTIYEGTSEIQRLIIVKHYMDTAPMP
ncbi:MAG: acyl-CoA dehydrogenase family protein [Spirochaetota bacterium]